MNKKSLWGLINFYKRLLKSGKIKLDGAGYRRMKELTEVHKAR